MFVQDVGLKTWTSDSSVWTLTFCLLLFWTPVQGQYRLIGPSEPILAAPGDDVILPCHVSPEYNAVEKTVEWSKPDLKTRPSKRQSGVEYVLVYRFRKEDRDMMMASYIQRASLTGGLEHGDVSLRIRNVSLEDNGRFRCFIPNLRRDAQVLLVVDPNLLQTRTTETPDLDRNLITLEPQNETMSNARRSRPLLLLPIIIFIFFVFFSTVFIFYIKKASYRELKSNMLHKNLILSDLLHPSVSSSLTSVPSEIQTSNPSGSSSSSCRCFRLWRTSSNVQDRTP